MTSAVAAPDTSASILMTNDGSWIERSRGYSSVGAEQVRPSMSGDRLPFRLGQELKPRAQAMLHHSHSSTVTDARFASPHVYLHAPHKQPQQQRPVEPLYHSQAALQPQPPSHGQAQTQSRSIAALALSGRAEGPYSTAGRVHPSAARAANAGTQHQLLHDVSTVRAKGGGSDVSGYSHSAALTGSSSRTYGDSVVSAGDNSAARQSSALREDGAVNDIPLNSGSMDRWTDHFMKDVLAASASTAAVGSGRHPAVLTHSSSSTPSHHQDDMHAMTSAVEPGDAGADAYLRYQSVMQHA